MIIIISIVLFVVWLSFYFFGLKKEPVIFGVSFDQNYATWLGLDWKQTYISILTDLHPVVIRIPVVWDSVEPKQNQFNFSDIDWMMKQAKNNHVKVVLVIGQKTPRWPECHVPKWANAIPEVDMRSALLKYVRQTIIRYRNSSVLQSWQVENEPFINFNFGVCQRFDRAATYQEIDLVKFLDSVHPIMITDSGELSLWRESSTAGDILGTTVYRVVRTPNGIILRYNWLPAGWYKARAEWRGKDYNHFVISELQAEPWFASGDNPLNTPVSVQMETMSPSQMQKNIDYAKHVGASQAYFWGAEWWYFMKTKYHDSDFWNIAKRALSENVTIKH